MNSVPVSDALKVETIDKIVADSIAASAAPMRQPILGNPKRGRGRPRKGNAPNRATLQKINEEFTDKKTPPLQDAGVSHAAGSTDDPLSGGASIKGDDIPDSLIASALKVPSMIAREWTGYEGYTISDATVQDATPLAKQCIDLYFPDMERSKHFPLYMLCFTILFPLCKQTIEYQKFRAAKPVRATVTNAEAPTGPMEAPKPVQNDEYNPFRPVFP